MSHSMKTKILFVCYGNICRSPSAEGIFKQRLTHLGLIDHFEVDSAGTHDFHIGKQPDERAIHAAQKIGVDLSVLQARQVTVEDLDHYDYLFVMDPKNKANLLPLCSEQQAKKIVEFISFLPGTSLTQVNDPFHGEPEDFDDMMELLNQLCAEAIKQLTVQKAWSALMPSTNS